MVARNRMTMRCGTSRDVDSNTVDSFNQPITSRTSILLNHPCYWQARTETFIEDGDKVSAVEVHRMMFPLGSDVLEQDFITEVRDRRGRLLYDGTLNVKSALPRENMLATVLEEYH